MHRINNYIQSQFTLTILPGPCVHNKYHNNTWQYNLLEHIYLESLFSLPLSNNRARNMSSLDKDTDNGETIARKVLTTDVDFLSVNTITIECFFLHAVLHALVLPDLLRVSCYKCGCTL